MSHTKGLQFKKIDLHIHTPASDDAYRTGTKPTAKDLVEKALAMGLSAIAVTDHQTASFVDQMKAAAKGTGLVVFPGVELMVAGGENGIHLNLIFDVDKDAEHIHQFLNSVKVFTKDGKPTVLAAEITVGNLADALAVYDPTAIVVLAHCNSAKGVTNEMRGEVRTQVFQVHRTNILGAEAGEANFTSAELKSKHNRIVDVFDGTDENYYYRRLGVIQASDAHELDAIGSTPTWFKVDEPLTIEDLRQCFIDRDTRIRQTFEFNPTTYPRVESLVVNSGFIKDQQFEFHDGLNSILGAKGSGKSLVIEALRFALDQSPKLSPIREDHFAKLEKCVKPYGAVRVVVVDETGKRYQITRTFSPTDGHPTVIVDLSDMSEKSFSVPEVFPVLFLSQNEIIRIAEDSSGASLRGFIDRFFDFHHHQHLIDAITKELVVADRRVAEALRAHLSLAAATRKAATYKEEIERLGRQLQNATFDKFARAEAIGLAIRTQKAFVADLQADFDAEEIRLKDIQPPVQEGAPSGEAAVKRSIDAATAAIKGAREHQSNAKAELGTHLATIEREYRTWETEFAPIKAEYETVVKETGGSQVALDQRRRRVIADLASVEKQISADANKAGAIRAAFEGRKAVLDRLDAAYQAYLTDRQDRCVFFTSQSHGAISVTIDPGRDVSQFKAKLIGIKKGSYLKDEDIDQIVRSVTPRELVAAVLSFEFKGRSDKKPLQDLATSKKIRPELIERLATHILEGMEYAELLGLMYETAPQDVPQISYEVADVLKPLAELSVGQKAAALLIVGLSDGRFPIIIDQPEDSLDLRSIWDDVCTTIRDSKESRQFVFTTHNSSVAVASDSDKFTILEAGATQARILFSGSMNSPAVRKEVIDYLEGGPDTYDKKRTKYNIHRRSEPTQ